ncbi:Glycosyltransferase Family 5 protein [Gigaspora rosea]|uniref:Glycosyltransferase Family 5 protein n=1 Tax=Gigaspora rosea TaxID=44941 RepID=A0A397VUY0_9GLOM|nr:Glycosyltransferase Family 5 protein [Gigaspora rosea]
MDQYEYENSQYIRNNRLFVSSLAVDKSQMVTFMSEGISREMVEGPLDFDFKELVLPNILNKASIGRISYGFDVIEPNPFKNKFLKKAMPFFQKSLNPLDLYVNNVNNISTEDLIVVSKLNAKKYLIQEGLLSEEDLERPLVLFDGTFEVIGFQFIREAISTLAALDAKFLIMGQRNNYPVIKLKKMIEDYPDHLIIIYEPEVRVQWAVHFYAAADIQYVPDLSENFGLVAAEGLLFDDLYENLNIKEIEDNFLLDSEVNKKYCKKEKDCRVLFMYYHSGQELKANIHLKTFFHIAGILNRTIGMVLTNVGRSRIESCNQFPFEFYYNLNALRKLLPNINFISVGI